MNKKQIIAIAVLIVTGVLFGTYVVLKDNDRNAQAQAINEEHGHGHGAKDEHGHEHDAKDEHGHEHTEEESQEIVLTAAQIASSGIVLHTTGSALIKSSLQLPGEIRFNENLTAHVVPSVSGIVQSVPANLGDSVKKGEILAVLASSSVSELRSQLLAAQKRVGFAQATYAREKQLWEEKISARQDYLTAQQDLRETQIALQNVQQQLKALGATPITNGELNRFEVRAPFDGMVIEKHIALGESIKEDTNIFTVSDLNTVWAEIIVPAKDLDTVRVGSQVTVRSTASDSKATGKVAYVSSLIGDKTRTAKAIVVLPNPNMAWRPGLYVSVQLAAEETQVPVAITTDAIQSLDGKPTVFVRVADGFIAQPVTLGRSDEKLVEIVTGLKVGQTYAGAGSFIIKSELGKGSASHEH